MHRSNNAFLASLAVFRKLYDEEKDVYQIISEFIEEVIFSKGLHSFTLTKITRELKETFDFDIPEAIVKSSLKRLRPAVKKQGSDYVCDFRNLKHPSIRIKEVKENNRKILKKLYEYIEKRYSRSLTKKDKVEIINALCSYIIDDEHDQGYIKDISAFIIKNEKDNKFQNQLRLIKEGIILYTGLKFNPSPMEIKNWKNKLTIFLDTEILFNAAGYNGDLYKAIFDDLYNLISEINTINAKTNGKDLIDLRYFQETENEINNFFRSAENIIRNRRTAAVDPSKTAMRSIINGSKDPAEIISKKVKFENLLKNRKISVFRDVQDFYDEKFHTFNIENQELLERVQQNFKIDEEEAHKTLKFLNYIHILREKNKTNALNFEEVGYIFLTGTSHVLKTSIEVAKEVDKEIPLATTIYFLTNKFWIKLNKGFGKNEYPKSFDIVTKAQIVLSSELSHSISKMFDELCLKTRRNELSKKEALDALEELRSRSFKPEDIVNENLEEILSTIDEGELEKISREKDLLKSKLSEEKHKTKELEDKLREIEEENLNIKMTLNKALNKLQKSENTRKQIYDVMKKISYGIFFIILFILYDIHKTSINKIISREWRIVVEILSVIAPIFQLSGVSADKFKKIPTNLKSKIISFFRKRKLHS